MFYNIYLILKLCKYYRSACGIEVPNSDQVVITGGHASRQNGLSRVQVYTVSGAKEQLPDLNQPRYTHACGYFFNGNNLVKSLIIYIILLLFSQVYLVAGVGTRVLTLTAQNY